MIDIYVEHVVDVPVIVDKLNTVGDEEVLNEGITLTEGALYEGFTLGT